MKAFVIITVLLITIAFTAEGRAPLAPKKQEPRPNSRILCTPNGEVQFQWSAVPGATSYMIEISTCYASKRTIDCDNPDDNPSAFSPADRDFPLEIGTTDTRYTARLEPGKEYWWRMWAKRGRISGRKSSWSNFHCVY